MVRKSIKSRWGEEGGGPAAGKMMGGRVHGNTQQSEIDLIGTTGLLLTYLLNWHVEGWEGESKQGLWLQARAKRKQEVKEHQAHHSWSQSTSSPAQNIKN